MVAVRRRGALSFTVVPSRTGPRHPVSTHRLTCSTLCGGKRLHTSGTLVYLTLCLLDTGKTSGSGAPRGSFSTLYDMGETPKHQRQQRSRVPSSSSVVRIRSVPDPHLGLHSYHRSDHHTRLAWDGPVHPSGSGRHSDLVSLRVRPCGVRYL